MSIFTNLWSWSFLVGLIAGFVLNRAIALVRVCALDKRKPLPDGKRRSKWAALSIDRRWLVGLIAVAFLGWSVITTSANAEENKALAEENARLSAEAAAFAERVQRCQAALITAIQGSRDVTTQNDRLSIEERRLLADGQRVVMEFAGQLLDPVPPDEQRERVRLLFERLAGNQALIDAKEREQAQNERDRPPLPAPSCGS
ncbi:hypothetical protein KDW75_gp33 [Mycobacterium phage Mercurio]|uniref:Uncharacterized protein n=1 Tax=Mycobacterium phage Mercurio TaxID=2575612 RepID=A0A5J6TCW4_9CAUD|nr:hypothetical protein KDW75_gp33 [Mycobacterium phage Mercurio]QFG06035.1 hypothetical protein PBI_MERCURIO_33 [Mycobacterium phage Mercurio]